MKMATISYQISPCNRWKILTEVSESRSGLFAWIRIRFQVSLNPDPERLDPVNIRSDPKPIPFNLPIHFPFWPSTQYITSLPRPTLLLPPLPHPHSQVNGYILGLRFYRMFIINYSVELAAILSLN